MIVLGFESSCDETAAAVVEDGRIVRSNVIATSVAEQALYGGVVPEIASRRHAESISMVADKALADAGMTMQDIARFSNIKLERGTNYPFARTINFNLSIMFK